VNPLLKDILSPFGALAVFLTALPLHTIFVLILRKIKQFMKGQNEAKDQNTEININTDENVEGTQHLNEPVAEEGEVEKLKEQIDELNDKYLRQVAEFVNFRRRTTEEREAMLGLAAEGLIRKVLALADDFDLAVEHRPDDGGAEGSWVEGIVAIDRKLRQLLESEGVTAIEASPGTRFDPREHEAVANVPNTGRPGGEIVDELRRGYRLRDRVIRPALVAVAEDAGPAAAPASDEAVRDTNESIH